VIGVNDRNKLSAKRTFCKISGTMASENLNFNQTISLFLPLDDL
jgi:hypothetical protein